MDDPRNIEELIMDNGLPQNKPVTLKDVEKINKEKHHKNMQNKIHRIDDSYQLPGEKPMSTADKPTSKFMDAMQQVLANEAEIMEKKTAKLDPVGKEDDDVDNDGDTDSSDKYLKNRRSAIGKAIAKEEVEPLDELSDATLTNYGKAALNNQLKRQSNLEPGEKTSRQIENRKKGQERQLKKQGIWNPSTKEEVEPLAELSMKTLGSYRTKAASDDKDRSKGRNLSSAKMYPDQYKNSPLKAKVPATEEVEPLAELSKNTLKDYVKGAVGAKSVGDRTRSIPTLAAQTGRASEKSQAAAKAGDYSTAKMQKDAADKSFDKSQQRRKNVSLAVDKLVAKEEIERDKYGNGYYGDVHQTVIARKGNIIKPTGLHTVFKKTVKKQKPEEANLDEAATVLLRKGGATKRMRYNPATIARLKGEGWVVAAEAFVDKVKALFDIAEDISFEDALSLVEAVDEVKRGRGRPKKAVDPNAAPKREWKPGGRGRPPKNKESVTKVSTSDTKSADEPKAAAETGDTGHILDHLRKAVSTNGTNSFRQKNGGMAKVSQSAALALLTHHDKLPKASDRFKMQQHLAKSPEHLQSAIKNVGAGKPYNAGYEVAKPKAISLAAPDWNDKKKPANWTKTK